MSSILPSSQIPSNESAIIDYLRFDIRAHLFILHETSNFLPIVYPQIPACFKTGEPGIMPHMIDDMRLALYMYHRLSSKVLDAVIRPHLYPKGVFVLLSSLYLNYLN